MVLSGYGGLVFILLAGKRTMIAPEYNSDQRAPPVNYAYWIRADHIPPTPVPYPRCARPPAPLAVSFLFGVRSETAHAELLRHAP